MKRIITMLFLSAAILSACEFLFTFDNPADPLSESFTGTVTMNGVQDIEDISETLLVLAGGRVYGYERYSMIPERLRGLPEGIIALSSSGTHTLALDGDGTVWSWGNDTYGQLGREIQGEAGGATLDSTPGSVGITGVSAIRSAEMRSAALTDEGEVFIWGDWSRDNTSLRYDEPDELATGFTVVDLAIADGLLLLREGGTVYHWDASLSSPEQMTGLTDITALSASGDRYTDHYLALDEDGAVWAWGRNSSGQLGDGTRTDNEIPTMVPGLGSVTAVGARYASAGSTSFALTDAGLYAWGDNQYGQLGKEWNKLFCSPVLLGTAGKIGGGTPILVHPTVTDSGFTLVYTDAAELYGYGAIETNTLPISGYVDGCVTDLSAYILGNDFTAAGAALGYGVSGGYQGSRFGLLISDAGRVYGWGDNSNGLMGNGTTTWVSAPEDTGITGIGSLSCKGTHAVALKTDGTVIAWGEGSNGELGNGSNNDSLVPVNVTGLTGVTDVAAGTAFSLAVVGNDTLWGWGSSYYGQIGGSTRSTAEQISGLSGITAIAAGSSHALALKDDGTVWALGYNGYGQLGNGTTVDSSIPVQVTGLSGVTALAADGDISVALKGDGTVWAWGYASNNSFSQGDDAGFVTYTEEPFQIPGVSTAAAVTAANGQILILFENGSLAVTGSSGDLTTDTLAEESAPGPYPLDAFVGMTLGEIYGGSYGFIVIDEEGNAYCW